MQDIIDYVPFIDIHKMLKPVKEYDEVNSVQFQDCCDFIEDQHALVHGVFDYGDDVADSTWYGRRVLEHEHDHEYQRTFRKKGNFFYCYRRRGGQEAHRRGGQEAHTVRTRTRRPAGVRRHHRGYPSASGTTIKILNVPRLIFFQIRFLLLYMLHQEVFCSQGGEAGGGTSTPYLSTTSRTTSTTLSYETTLMYKHFYAKDFYKDMDEKGEKYPATYNSYNYDSDTKNISPPVLQSPSWNVESSRPHSTSAGSAVDVSYKGDVDVAKPYHDEENHRLLVEKYDHLIMNGTTACTKATSSTAASSSSGISTSTPSSSLMTPYNMSHPDPFVDGNNINMFMPDMETPSTLPTSQQVEPSGVAEASFLQHLNREDKFDVVDGPPNSHGAAARNEAGGVTKLSRPRTSAKKRFSEVSSFLSASSSYQHGDTPGARRVKEQQEAEEMLVRSMVAPFRGNFGKDDISAAFYGDRQQNTHKINLARWEEATKTDKHRNPASTSVAHRLKTCLDASTSKVKGNFARVMESKAKAKLLQFESGAPPPPQRFIKDYYKSDADWSATLRSNAIAMCLQDAILYSSILRQASSLLWSSHRLPKDQVPQEEMTRIQSLRSTTWNVKRVIVPAVEGRREAPGTLPTVTQASQGRTLPRNEQSAPARGMVSKSFDVQLFSNLEAIPIISPLHSRHGTTSTPAAAELPRHASESSIWASPHDESSAALSLSNPGGPQTNSLLTFLTMLGTEEPSEDFLKKLLEQMASRTRTTLRLFLRLPLIHLCRQEPSSICMRPSSNSTGRDERLTTHYMLDG
ncbi:unnamed protein product [Amoebophrya sp. A25]|nr:unnamed protein product [Amoebophrya sp. A25]|eukprot:GSA25T00008262001.1